MLSVGPGAARFSPPQNIRVILLTPRPIGNGHYRQHTPTSSQSGFAGRAGGGGSLSSRIVILLSKIRPVITRCAGAGREGSRPTASRRDDP